MFLVYSGKGMTGSFGLFAQGCFSCRFVQGKRRCMSEDSEFEQGLEMLTVALAFSYIILLRIADLPAKWPISPGYSGWDSFDSLRSACFGCRVFL